MVGKHEFIEIQLLVSGHGREAVTIAVADYVRRRLFSLEAVKAALHSERVHWTIQKLVLDHIPDLADGRDQYPARWTL
jgi:hypothetical protein